jgi:signal transduction histidine kinase
LVQPAFQLAVAVLGIVAVLAFSAFFYLYRPYDGLGVYSENPLGEIYEVVPGGPGAQAGIQVGDLILAIDNRSLNPSVSAPRYRPGIRQGDVVMYRLQRGAETLEIPVQIGSYWNDLPLLASYLGIQLLSLGLWLIGLLLVVFTSPGDARARLLGLGFLLAGAAAAAGGASGWNSFWGANTIQKILLSLLAAILLTAHLTFPKVTFPKYRPRLITAAWLATLLLCVLVIAGDWLLAHQGVSLHITYGISLRQIVLTVFLLAWLASIASLARSRLAAASPETRRQTGIIIWGMLLGISPFFTLTLLPYLILGEEYVTGAFSILFLILLPLAYAYVIFQRQLLRIDLVINRLLVTFVVLLLILTLSILLFGAIALAFDLPRNTPLYGGLVAALIALPFPWLQARVQARVNRVLYGSHYDSLAIAADLSQRLAGAMERHALIDTLVKYLPRQMGVLETALWLNDGRSLRLVEGNLEPNSIQDLQQVFHSVFQDNLQPARAAELWARFPDQMEAQAAKFAWSRLFVPLVYEEQLNGLLVLGSRVAGEVYSDQDLLMLSAVSRQAGLAWANVLLVEQYRRISQELVRSDEAQRKQLAGDLHDSLLQDLFYIKQLLYQRRADAELVEQLGASIDRLRQVIKAQRPAVLDRGLKLAFEDLVGEACRRTNGAPQIALELELADELDLPEESLTHIYRIAQEALANALKYAQAKSVRISLHAARQDGLRLVVEDDGIGMDHLNPIEVSNSGHFGLALMRERAAMIGATLSIQSQSGGGTSVTLELCNGF